MYSFSVFLASVSYLAVVFALYKVFFPQNISRSSLHFGAVSVLVIAVLFKPLELFLHRLLEKYFFKGTIDEISEQRERLQIELERRERLKSVGILAAGMAHEIKNPITAIKTFAEYLPDKYDDPEFREKFKKIISSETHRISQIVNDLLVFAKPAEPKKEKCIPVDLVKAVTELLSADFFKQNIRIEWGRVERTCVSVDAGQIKQVLINLILNAIHAMRRDQREKVLRLEVYEENGQVILTVSDNGCGISPAMMTHLFDPFFTDKEDGTGLGLAISHSIIEKNGGHITVQSQTGIGTSFFIYLPALA
jgi:polar amino acid transport system substrate-binding protein